MRRNKEPKLEKVWLTCYIITIDYFLVLSAAKLLACYLATNKAQNLLISTLEQHGLVGNCLESHQSGNSLVNTHQFGNCQLWQQFMQCTDFCLCHWETQIFSILIPVPVCL